MTNTNNKNSGSFVAKLLIYGILLFIWLHFCHLASWCNGTYSDSYFSVFASEKMNRVVSLNNWPITVVEYQGRMDLRGIDLIIYSIIEAVTDPLNLKGLVLAEGGMAFIIMNVVFLIYCWSEALKHQNYKQDAAGKEYGSAAWKTLEEIIMFRKTKAEFYWRDYCNKHGNPSLSLLLAALFNSKVTTPDGFGLKPLRGKEALKKFNVQKKNNIEDPNVIVGMTSDGGYLKYSLNNKYTSFNVSEVLVGSAGKGKTFRHIKPRLAQMNSSFIVTDPSGEIMADMGMMLLKHGYKVKLFSTSDMTHTDCYNPLDYIYGPDGETVDQTKVGILVSTFMTNADSTKKGAKGGDDFWKKAPQAFLSAVIYFCVDFMPVEQRNMATILKLTQMGKTNEGPGATKTELDKLFDAAQKENPRSKAFEYYGVFKLAPAKTANSILISLGVDMTKFADDAVYNMTCTDYLCKRDENTGLIKEYVYSDEEMKKDPKDRRPIRSSRNIDLDKIGDEMTAIFINIPQANAAYNFLVSMMYAQMFDVLYSKAESICPERFHIYDNNGFVLSSQYKTEEIAQKTIRLFAGSSVREEEKKGVTRFYIYNENADIEESLPECGKGYLKEVFSPDVGNNLISRYKDAEVKPGDRRLPIHVVCLLDEFANIGSVPDFEKIPATSRKYEISVVIVIQSFAQLEGMYDKMWEVLLGNCSTLTYLGSTEYKTQEYISKMLGKTTIRTVNESMSKQSGGGSKTDSFQKMGRDLMTIDEVGRIDQNHEIVFIDGQKYFVEKLDFSLHPHFSESGTADRKNMLTKAYLDQHYRCEDKHRADEESIIRIGNKSENRVKMAAGSEGDVVEQMTEGILERLGFTSGGSSKPSVKPTSDASANSSFDGKKMFKPDNIDFVKLDDIF